MKSQLRILIAEKDMILASNLALQMVNMGFLVSAVESRGEDALAHCRNNLPDVVLTAIDLAGEWDGVETAGKIKQLSEIPIVFLTQNDSEAIFDRARAVHPHAFISKPFSKLQMSRTMALIAEQLKFSRNGKAQNNQREHQLKDRIFIRHHGKMVRLYLDDIRYVEADRNYCRIVTESSSYLLVATLKAITQQLPVEKFIRVHRSYMVNVDKLDCITEHHVEIARKVIPVSRSHRGSLMSRLQTL